MPRRGAGGALYRKHIAVCACEQTLAMAETIVARIECSHGLTQEKRPASDYINCDTSGRGIDPLVNQ
jgi:hypothetical protein